MNIKIFPYFIKNYFSKATPTAENLSKETFIPLVFEKKQSIRDARGFGAINFRIRNIETNNLNEYNEINQLCTKIYNLTEGQVKFPPSISIKKQKTVDIQGLMETRPYPLLKATSGRRESGNRYNILMTVDLTPYAGSSLFLFYSNILSFKFSAKLQLPFQP